MSNILLAYAQDITNAANAQSQAYAQSASIHANHAQNMGQSINALGQSLQNEQALKLKKQELDNAKEANIMQAEESSKMLQTLALADKKDAKGNPIGIDQAMNIVDTKIAQERAKRAANAPQHHTSIDYTLMGLGGLGYGSYALGKKLGKKTIDSYYNFKSTRQSKKPQAQAIAQNFSQRPQANTYQNPQPNYATELTKPQTTPSTPNLPQIQGTQGIIGGFSVQGSPLSPRKESKWHNY